MFDLLASKITPKTVIDCGCHKGDWHNQARLRWPDAHFILIDANPANLEAMQATGAEYYIAVLSDCEKEVTFYTRKDDPTGCTGDSLFKELTPWYDDPIETKVTTTTLDNLLFCPEMKPPVLLKIDTQGAELDILKGAKCSMNYIDALVLEVAVFPYNEGAPMYNEVEAWLKENGFKLDQVIDRVTHPLQPELVIQQDVYYVKK